MRSRPLWTAVLTIVCRTMAFAQIHFFSLSEVLMRDNIKIYFGRRVREERLQLGLSQEELALRTGVHRTYIGMIERGEKNITLVNIEKIASALAIEISELFKPRDS